jgi:hypothetical protein
MRPSRIEEIPRWRVVHWQGSRKPWMAKGVLGEAVLPALNDLWRDECHSTWNHSCLSTAAGFGRAALLEQKPCDGGEGIHFAGALHTRNVRRGPS